LGNNFTNCVILHVQAVTDVKLKEICVRRCLLTIIIEGFWAKRGYIAFRGEFLSLQDQVLSFGRLTCFGIDMKSIVASLVLLIYTSFSRTNVCKKIRFSEHHLLKRKTLKMDFSVLQTETFTFSNFNSMVLFKYNRCQDKINPNVIISVL